MFVPMPTPSEKTQSRIATFKVPVDEYERLEQVARDEERSVSAVLRLALRDYLESRDGVAA